MTDFIQKLHDLDRSLTLAVNSWSTPATDQLWQFFSDTKVWIPLYIAVGTCIILRLGWKKGLVAIASLGLTFALCDYLSDLVKDSVCRLRPAYDTTMLQNGIRLLEGRGGFFGFFSSHAANTFGFAACSWIGLANDKSRSYSGYGTIIFFWAFMVSASRIFVGKHFLGDILIGAVFGLAVGYLVAKAARAAITRLR